MVWYYSKSRWKKHNLVIIDVSSAAYQILSPWKSCLMCHHYQYLDFNTTNMGNLWIDIESIYKISKLYRFNEKCNIIDIYSTERKVSHPAIYIWSKDDLIFMVIQDRIIIYDESRLSILIRTSVSSYCQLFLYHRQPLIQSLCSFNHQ